MKFETFNTKLHCLASYVQKLQKSPVLLRSDGIRQGLLICCLNPYILKLSRVRDCAAEARPADETAEAEQGQRSVFASGLPPTQKKQNTATKPVVRSTTEGAILRTEQAPRLRSGCRGGGRRGAAPVFRGRRPGARAASDGRRFPAARRPAVWPFRS